MGLYCPLVCPAWDLLSYFLPCTSPPSAKNGSMISLLSRGFSPLDSERTLKICKSVVKMEGAIEGLTSNYWVKQVHRTMCLFYIL